jgi:hypothetical protein
MIQLFKTSVLAMIIAFSGHSMAFGIKLPGVGGGADVGGLEDKQTKMLALMQVALTDLLESQKLLANALDLKEQVAAIEDSQAAVSGGEIDKKVLKQVQKSTLAFNKSIQELNDSGAALNGDQKAAFQQAMVPYARGTIAMFSSLNIAKDAASDISGIKNPLELRKIGSLIYVVKELPKLLTNFSSSTKSLIGMGKANNIETDSLSNIEIPT